MHMYYFCLMEGVDMLTNRKFFLFVICLYLAVFSLRDAAWADEEFLTLKKALTLARENNPSLKIARERVIQLEADFDEASSALGPKLQAQAGYTRYNEESRNPVLNSDNGPTGDYIMESFEDTWQAALTLTQVLYSGGVLTANRAAANLQVNAQRARETRTLQGVENQVSKAYYDLQRARATLEVAEESVRLAKEHLAEVQALFKHGVVAKNEVLRVQVDVSNAELSRIQADNRVNVTWKELSRTVGVPFPKGTELPKPEMKVKVLPLPPNSEEVALSGRPEMKALEFARKAALQSVKAAGGQAKPQVVFEGRAQDVGDEFYPDVQDEWTLSLVARWTLYDHGKIAAQVKKARALARDFLGQVEDMEKQIVLEVATAQLTLESSLQRLDVARDQVVLAEEDYRMALQRYKVQAGTNLDVLDARVALITARNNLVASVYDSYTAQADFVHALGLMPGETFQ